ncbi:vitamin K epoxide reductase family protein [Candidatus Microgenomates bacterium]|nr:vitamin K epoxide reductase family protein [Candidatus Microgenomates bacterium]
MSKKLNRIIFIQSIIGLLIAIYVFQSFVRQSPIVCVNGGCELVRKSPYSYFFGFFPVPGVGLFGYAFMMVLSFLRTTSNNRKLLYGILGMAAFGVLFVTWFTYTEIFLIKGICTWCALSAVNMYLILILALKSYFLEKNKK